MFAVQQPPHAFDSASQAVEQLIHSITTPLCVIAIALIGFSALSGRLPIRRGAVAIVGCFVLLGSVQISQALLQLADATPSASVAQPIVSGSPALLYERPALPPLPEQRRFRGVTTPGE